MIKIVIDNKEYSVLKGKTILQVAEENNIHIPTLCHDKELNPFGSCWVCAVKVKGRRGFVTACGTEVSSGMEISTNTNEVKSARKMALELLLSDHYADCEAPCKIACPDNVDIQSYVSLIANGQYHEAVKVIKETLPMPLSIGRVCPAFCEEECRRSVVDEPIAIRQLKRHAADFDLTDDWNYIPQAKEAKSKKVAIIGGGPSGLTCGFYLSTEGYKVDVFESSPAAGGWLRYGIPEYRLPKKILSAEIKLMCKNGMKIHTNKEVGKNITLSSIYKKYDAIYFAIGAQKAVPLRLSGSNNSKIKGCHLGIDFLKKVALNRKVSLGRRVAVIGGGNTAIDCARTAKRLGSDVTIIYRRTKNEMPAEDFEIKAAEEEGIKFYFLTYPDSIIEKRSRIFQLRLGKMVLCEADESGRRRPKPTGEFFEERFNSVIAAISQTPDVDFLVEENGNLNGEMFPLTRWSTADVDETTMFSGIDKVFAGGDFRRGPATAIEAIADGRKAAETIGRYLAGEKIEKSAKPFNSQKVKKISELDSQEFENYPNIDRAVMPELEVNQRIGNFKEVETGFSDETAINEAKRCLECGCHVNSSCNLRNYATEYEVDPDIFWGEENIHPIDDSHPFILRDANKCIKCGRCVRICAEVQGPGVLGYIYRGFTSYVAPEMGNSLKNTTCESCGKCIEVCPVGALLPKNQNYKLNPSIAETITQNCGLCGIGCEIEIGLATDKITTISTPKKNPGFNDRNLCFNGRFGWQGLEEPQRILHSFLRRDKENEWKGKEKPWIEMNSTTEIAKLIKDKWQKSTTKQIFISPTSTNEEILLMKEIAQNIGAEISSISYRENFLDPYFNTNVMETTFDDLKKSKAIVVIGHISGTLRNMIRAEQRKGKKLIIISQEQESWNKFADDLLDFYTIPESIEKILNYYYDDPDHEEIKTVFDDVHVKEEVIPKHDIQLDLPDNTVFVYNRDYLSEEIIWNIWYLATVLCDNKNFPKVLETSDLNNLRGLINYQIKMAKPKESDFMIFYGELPNQFQLKYVHKSDFIVSVNTHIDQTDPANLIIPQPSYLEIEGSSYASDGKLRKYHNPKKSTLFADLLEIFSQAELISDEMAKPKYWIEKVENIKVDEGYKKINSITFLNYLNSVDTVCGKVHHPHLVQKIMLKNMKILTKDEKIDDDDCV